MQLTYLFLSMVIILLGKNRDTREFLCCNEGRVDNWLFFVHSVILTSSTYINERTDLKVAEGDLDLEGG